MILPKYNDETFEGYLQADLNQKLFIGGRSDSNTRSFNGNISEILIFDTVLTLEERSEVQAYLATKWDLESTTTSQLWSNRAPLTRPKGIYQTPFYNCLSRILENN